MKRTTQLIIAFLLCTTSFLSQVKSDKAEIEWGPEQKEAKKSSMGGLVAHDESGIYVTKYKSKLLSWPIISLEHLDKNLNKTKSVILEFGSKKEKRSLEHIIHSNKMLYLFS